MSALASLLAVIVVAFFPWALWFLFHRAWLRWKERRVLVSKYGDLEMFQARLKEWKLLRKPRR